MTRDQIWDRFAAYTQEAGNIVCFERIVPAEHQDGLDEVLNQIAAGLIEAIATSNDREDGWARVQHQMFMLFGLGAWAADQKIVYPLGVPKETL